MIKYLKNKRYYWQGNNLRMEKDSASNSKIYYYYDESGVCGMNLDGVDYYYRKNMLGDVCAIYNGVDELVCRYAYDAWGNHRLYNKDGKQINDDGTMVGSKNPFRYRGYYWDREFGLYYLQSRYYDPALGRFISPDGIGYLAPQSINGMNLYAYCGNNPVMYTDSNGRFIFGVAFVVGALFWMTATTIVGALVGLIDAAIKNENILDGMKNGATIGAMFGASGLLTYLGLGTPLSGCIIGTTFTGIGFGSTSSLLFNISSQSRFGGVATWNTSQLFTSWWKGGIVGGAVALSGEIFNEYGKHIGDSLGATLSERTFLGVKFSKIISSKKIINTLKFLGGCLGGFIGGKSINYGATNSEEQDEEFPAWLISILKFFGFLW